MRPAGLRPAWLVGGVVAVLVALVAGLAVGPVALSPAGVAAELLDLIPGVHLHSGLTDREAAIVTELRLPRVVLGLLVGAMLALAPPNLYERLTLLEDERARVRPHAGLDIGARTPKEIALSILAEMVAVRRAPAVPSRRRTIQSTARMLSPNPGQRNLPSSLLRNQLTMKILGSFAPSVRPIFSQ